MTRWYNSKTGIKAALCDLESFHALIDERYTAGYFRRERLDEFCVLGRYWLDSNGNIGIMSGQSGYCLPQTAFDLFPKVIATAELESFARSKLGGNALFSYSLGTARGIPAPGVACIVCEQTWTIEDCHDCTVKSGDDGFVYYHTACWRSKLAIESQCEIQILLDVAGFSRYNSTLTPVPNQYGSEEYEGPWQALTMAAGVITIGWRKRVINIDWSDTCRDLLHLFEDVTNTKDSYYIHAWTYEQAIDYLRRIRLALSPVPQPAG